MRIEKLTKDKIKVTLTTSELSNLDIDVEQLGPDSKELHTFLFHIMETIREKTGFNPYSGQVVVEATPSHEGISIMVKRLKSETSKITKNQFARATSVKAKSKKESSIDIFYFEKFNDLCAALIETKRESLLESQLYRLNNTYCFMIKNEPQHTACINVMTEFSVKKSTYPLQITYIKEHGELVAKGKKLVNMAEKIRYLI